jgi:hypothetical protein
MALPSGCANLNNAPTYRDRVRGHVIDLVEHQLGGLAEMHEEQHFGDERERHRHLERGQALQPSD